VKSSKLDVHATVVLAFDLGEPSELFLDPLMLRLKAGDEITNLMVIRQGLEEAVLFRLEMSFELGLQL
jgi:hypothetical protein